MRGLSRLTIVALVLALPPLAATTSLAASEKLGTHKEQSARRYCWKRMGLKPDAEPTSHQAARLRPCVTKRLGHEDPYMDQF